MVSIDEFKNAFVARTSYAPQGKAEHQVESALKRLEKTADTISRTADTTAGTIRQGLVDLVGLLGYYTHISMTLKAFDVPSPDGAGPFDD